MARRKQEEALAIAIDKFGEKLNDSSFRAHKVSLSSNRIAFGMDNHLFITSLLELSGVDPTTGRPYRPFIENMIQPEEFYGFISALCWLSDDVLCVGFETGLIACYTDQGVHLVHHKFHEIPALPSNNNDENDIEISIAVQSLKLSEKLVPNMGICLYILFEDGHFVGVSLSSLLSSSKKSTIYQQSAAAAAPTDSSIFKFKLPAQENTCDFVSLPYASFHFSGSNNNNNNIVDKNKIQYDVILGSGYNSTVSVYDLGSNQPPSSLNKLMNNLKDRVASALTRSMTGAISSWFGYSGSGSPAISTATDGTDDSPVQGGGATSTLSLNQSSNGGITPPMYVRIPTTSPTKTVDLLQDSKRKVLRVSMDPTGKLIATADSLGRVMLFDTRLWCMVRLWKGVRDARFAWTMGASRTENTTKPNHQQNKTTNASGTTGKATKDKRNKLSLRRRNGGMCLCLAIYAPQLSLLSIWKMRHGPCIRSIPVGPQCHIFTVYEASPMSPNVTVSKCALLRVAIPDKNIPYKRIELSVLSPTDDDITPTTHSGMKGNTSMEADTSVELSRSQLQNINRSFRDVDIKDLDDNEDDNGEGYDEDTLAKLRELLVTGGGGGTRGRRNNNTSHAAHSNTNHATTVASGNVPVGHSDTMSEENNDHTEVNIVHVDAAEDRKKREATTLKYVKGKLQTSYSYSPVFNNRKIRNRCRSSSSGSTVDEVGGETGEDIEADLWSVMAEISTTKTLLECLNIIESNEKVSPSCIHPEEEFNPSQRPMDMSSSAATAAAAAASALTSFYPRHRFSLKFHRDICDLMYRVAQNEKNYKLGVESLLRRQLLTSYETLQQFQGDLEKSRRGNNNVFGLHLEHSKRQSTTTTTTAAAAAADTANMTPNTNTSKMNIKVPADASLSNEIIALTKQNTFRSEAYCWISRLCNKLLLQQQQALASMTSTKGAKKSTSSLPLSISTALGAAVNRPQSPMTFFSPSSSPRVSRSGSFVNLNNSTSVEKASSVFFGSKGTSSSSSSGGGGVSGLNTNTNTEAISRAESRTSSISESNSFDLTPNRDRDNYSINLKSSIVPKAEEVECNNHSITFSMFLYFHYFVWYKTPQSMVTSGASEGRAVGGSTGHNMEDLTWKNECCRVEFKSKMLLEMMNSSVAVAFKEEFYRKYSPFQRDETSHTSVNKDTQRGHKRSTSTATTPIRSGYASTNKFLTPASSTASFTSTLSNSSQYSTSGSKLMLQKNTMDSNSIPPKLLLSSNGNGSTNTTPVVSSYLPRSKTFSLSTSVDTEVSKEDEVSTEEIRELYDMFYFFPEKSDDGSADDNGKSDREGIPIWMAINMLHFLASPIVIELDVFIVNDYNTVVLEPMGLGNGWGLREFLPLVVCYLENLLPPTLNVPVPPSPTHASSTVANTGAPPPSHVSAHSTSITPSASFSTTQSSSNLSLFASPLAALAILVQNLLLYKQQLSSSPLQRWLRDTLLMFQESLKVNKSEELTESTAFKKKVMSLPYDLLYEQELIEELNEHCSRSITRTLFINQMLVCTGDSNGELLSFDIAVKFALQPLWMSMRRSTALLVRTNIEKGLQTSATMKYNKMMAISRTSSNVGVDSTTKSSNPNGSTSALRTAISDVMMGIVALFSEITNSVGDQLERRTYGVDHLHSTVATWEVLFRQYRVAVYLSSRGFNSMAAMENIALNMSFNPLITVHTLIHGESSIFRLLAEDTLCFAIVPDHAREHEAKCLEVYNKKKAQSSSSSSSSSHSAHSSNTSSSTTPPPPPPSSTSTHHHHPPLAMWGEGADKRWRELLSVTESEDPTVLPHSMNSPSTRSRKETGFKGGDSNMTSAAVPRKKKPLLLLFPYHNHPVPLGAYRGLLVAEKWCRKSQHVELLTYTVGHLYPLPPLTRAAVSLHICNIYLFPFIRAYLILEESSSSAGQFVASSTGATREKQSRIYSPGPSRNMNEKQRDLEDIPLPSIPKEFLNIIRNASNVNSRTSSATTSKSVEQIIEFIQSALDLIGFVDITNTPGYASPPSPSTDSIMSTSIVASTPTKNASSTHERHENEGQKEIRNVDILPVEVIQQLKEEANEAINAVYVGDTNKENKETSTGLWPSTTDEFLSKLVRQYQQAGGADNTSVKTHSSLLLVLLLKILTNLRRVRPSELFNLPLKSKGRKAIEKDMNLIDYICLYDSLTVKYCKNGCFTENCVSNSEINRKERGKKSSASGGSKNFSSVSEGSNMLNIDPDLQELRLEFIIQCFQGLPQSYTVAIYRLCELWGIHADVVKCYHVQALLEVGNDELVQEIASSKMSNVAEMIDIIIAGLRYRIGVCISRIEHIPQYGSLIISMDAEAVAWVRSVITIAPDPIILDGIAKGKIKWIDFDIGATRHLVMRLEGLLLGVPASATPEQVEKGQYRDHRWTKQKNNCDVLLSLCTSLSSFSMNNQHTGGI